MVVFITSSYRDLATLTLGVLFLLYRARASAPGASLPYHEYEVEDGTFRGELIGPNRTVGNVASEASNRRAVRLTNVGDYCEVTAAAASNTFVIRFAVPDNTTNATLGVLVDGERRATLSLSSEYAWVYGWDIPYDETPSSGNSAHHFFDEVRLGPNSLGKIEQGQRVRVQIDASDTAPEYYVIDLFDLEYVGPAKEQPNNTLSIVSFGGAVAGDGQTDRDEIQATIDEAARRGLNVWVPTGEFDVGSEGTLQNPGNVAVLGAGMWYSTFVGNTRFQCTGDGNCTFSDFAVSGMATNRVSGSTHAFYGGAGQSSRLSGVWVEHTVVGYWVGSGFTDDLQIKNSRFRNLYADGVNFCNGASHSIVENSHFRNTGDDAVASWAPDFDGGNNTGNVFRHLTVQLPWRANCMAVYGGRDNSIEDSLCYDTVTYPGVLLASEFNSWPFSGTTTVQRTKLIRAGGAMPSWGTVYGSLEINPAQRDVTGVRVSNVTIVDGSYAGVTVAGSNVVGGAFESIDIINSSTYGIEVDDDARGVISTDRVTIIGSGKGAVHNEAGDNFDLMNLPTVAPTNAPSKVPTQCVNELEASSAGWADGNTATLSMSVDPDYDDSWFGVGLNLVAINSTTMEVFEETTYNVFSDASADEDLVGGLKDLPNGTVVVLLAKDEASNRLSSASISSIQHLTGASQLVDIGWRSSYALIAYKSAGAPLAEAINATTRGAVTVRATLWCGSTPTPTVPPTTAPTPPPTSSTPTVSPSLAPSRPPSSGPSSVPSRSPSSSPSAMAISTPSPRPSNNPSAPHSTVMPTPADQDSESEPTSTTDDSGSAADAGSAWNLYFLAIGGGTLGAVVGVAGIGLRCWRRARGSTKTEEAAAGRRASLGGGIQIMQGNPMLD